MDITLTEQEANNVYVALVTMAKQPGIDAPTMKYLLILSDKFMVKKDETVKVEEVKETK